MPMLRRALNARWSAIVCLLSAQAGCSWIGLRNGSDHHAPNIEQAARNQDFSDHAQEAINRGDYEQARQELLKLATLVPKSAETQRKLGTVLQLEGRLPEAETCFRAALQRDPDYVEALVGLGQVEAVRGDIAPALKHFETAIEIEPHLAKAHYALGSLLQSQGKIDEALAEYFRALESEPNNTDVSLNVAAIQLAQNQPDQALSRLDRVVELAPEDGNARELRGRTHLALRHYSQAVTDFRAAIEKQPDRADIHYRLALALEGDHKPADALRSAEQALRLAPDLAQARELSQKLALATMLKRKAPDAPPRAVVGGTPTDAPK
jgi:tetratricopeptide (TPR) repeat protein